MINTVREVGRESVGDSKPVDSRVRVNVRVNPYENHQVLILSPHHVLKIWFLFFQLRSNW